MPAVFVKKVKSAWAAWKRIAHKIGNFQARVILTVLYAVAVLPVGLIVRFFSDPLRIKHPPTEWLEYPDEVHDMAWAKRQ